MKYEHQLLPIDIEYHVKDIGSAFAIQQDEPSSAMIDHMVANSGVREIAELVKTELNIKSPFFIEYSLIHSVLSPQARNRLTTFLYGEGEITFLENIKKSYTSIVAASAYKGVTVYQHPDVFINPSKGEVAFSISRMIGEAKEQVQFTEKPLTSLIIDKTSVYGYSEFHREYEEMLSVAERSRKDGISLKDLQRKLHELLHAVLLKGTNQSSYITIPIAGAEYDPSAGKLGFRRSKCHGVIFIYVANYLIEDDDIHKPLKRLHKKISNFVRYSSCNYLFNLGMSLLNSVRYYSISAAIGSIMSRNGSHNIGSHVLAALSHNVGTMPDDRVLYQYIQQRMDYIATATTDFPNWVQPTMLLGVLMKGFLSQRHLLDHISESEGLSAWQFQGCKLGNEAKAKQPWLQFHIRKWNNGKYIDLIEYDQEEGHNRVNLSEDVALAIPGGTVGNHAFYTIIENVIRNAAKHDWAVNVTAKDRPLPIYIDFKDSINERDVQIEIWAKVTALKVDDKTKGSLDKKGVESWIKRLDDGTDKDVSEFAQLPIHRQMQVLIERPFISNDGSLRRENWGLAEMKISAGYLNRIDIGAIGGLELEKYDPEHNCIILPIARKEGNEYYLAYRFYVPKPREVLIMVPDATNTTVVKKLENYGVYVRTQAAIRESGKENKRSLELNYRYVVVPSVSKDTFGKDIKFPFRVLSGSRLGDEHPQRLKNMIPELDSYKGIINSLKQIKTWDEKQLADKILGHIYDCWSRHLATYRQNDIGSAVGLLITPNEGNAGGGRSLISDDDVLKYVMRECFGECIRQYKKHDDQVSNKICDVFAVIEKDCYREEVDISKFHGTNNKIAALLHKWLTTALKDDDIRDNSFEITAQEMQRQLEEGYSINYQCDGSSTEAHSACDESVNNNNETAEEGLLINIDQIRAESKTTIEKRSKESALLAIGKLLKSGSIDGFIDYIVTVHEQAKQMFKQYEENIVSLPDGYMPEKGASSNSNVKEVTVNGIKVAFNHDALGGNAKWITYRRHDNTLDKGKGVVFAEPLSGTQSYLTQIMRLVSNLQAGEITATEKSLCARLLENGLMRVLVIDERVAKFVREHAAEVAKYYNSMAISVMDDNCQTTVIDAEQGPITQAASYFNEKSKATLKAYAEGKETSQNITALDFEILIIHQGILDKWFNEFKNDKEKMRKLLEGMKEMVKYVVITTGRGTPVNIPKDAHLIPFAVVEAALFRKYPEKLMLVDAVMNALPVGDVGAKGGPQ